MGEFHHSQKVSTCMAENASVDVLRFVDLAVERKSAWGPGEFASRQIEVNGRLLADILGPVAGHVVEQSTPLVDQHQGAITPAAYLRAMLGGPKDDPMPEGRIAIGYCDGCLDGSCGTLLGANLGIDGTTVTWSAVGFDEFDAGPAPKLTPFWKKAAKVEPEPVAGQQWTPAPFSPDVTFRFDRDQYLEAIQAERRRLSTGQL
jgi:hypothetical protein